MNVITRFYFVILLALLGAMVFIHKAHAVEVTPEIGFQKSQSPSPNGSTPQIFNPKDSLNNKIFSDNHLTQMVPDINSVGLDFTFKMD
jgi:hypothetical protein